VVLGGRVVHEDAGTRGLASGEHDRDVAARRPLDCSFSGYGLPMTSPADRPGLRESRNRRTRESIVRAAAQLTLDVGYAAATIDRIAELAGVSPRTVFGWFATKEAILLGPLPRQVERLSEHLADEEGDPVMRIEAWLREEGDRMGPQGDLPGLRYRAISHDQQLRAREQELFSTARSAIVAAAAADLEIDPGGAVPQAFAGAVMGMLQAFRDHAVTEAAGPSEREVASALAFLRAGISHIRNG
jgi:AcrR family transcriptional regulator